MELLSSTYQTMGFDVNARSLFDRGSALVFRAQRGSDGGGGELYSMLYGVHPVEMPGPGCTSVGR